MTSFEHAPDVFSLYPEVFVHAVSCMGLGHDSTSKKIKKIWPLYFAEYTRLCLRNQLTVDTCRFFPIAALFGTRFIALLAVRGHWKDVLAPQSVESCVKLFLEECGRRGVKSVAFPSFNPILDGYVKDIFLKNQSIHNIKTVFIYN